MTRDPNMRERVVINAVAQFAPTSAFTIEDLVVACWQLDPERFGLRGYRNAFPCAASVMSKVFGAQGVVAKGWLAKSVGDQARATYIVTDAGRDLARRFA